MPATDFATIYNVLPLWNASTPIDGTGQTIAIVGETDINPADFVNFRRLFNLPIGNTNTPTGTQYLNIIYNGPNPGLGSDEGEADIDTQWSGAVAKGATIDYVVSESTEVTQGTDLSAIYIVNNNLAPVMSYSYGQCERFLGTSGNAFFKNLWQQAAASGRPASEHPIDRPGSRLRLALRSAGWSSLEFRAATEEGPSSFCWWPSRLLPQLRAVGQVSCLRRAVPVKTQRPGRIRLPLPPPEDRRFRPPHLT